MLKPIGRMCVANASLQAKVKIIYLLFCLRMIVRSRHHIYPRSPCCVRCIRSICIRVDLFDGRSSNIFDTVVLTTETTASMPCIGLISAFICKFKSRSARTCLLGFLFVVPYFVMTNRRRPMEEADVLICAGRAIYSYRWKQMQAEREFGHLDQPRDFLDTMQPYY